MINALRLLVNGLSRKKHVQKRYFRKKYAEGLVDGFIETNGLFHPMKRYFRHAHTWWEIVFYTYGQGHLVMDQNEIPFKPGTVICIPPETDHHEVSKDGFMNQWVALTTLDAPKALQHFQISPEHPVFALMNILHVESRQDRRESVLIVRNLFQTFLLYLQAWMVAEKSTLQTNLIKQDICSHLSDPHFKIRDTLSNLNLSVDHARRIFYRQTGMTPKDYLIRERMAQAREMLMMGLSVKATAYICGYIDPYHFSKYFSKHHGISPSEWKKQHVK